MLKLPKIIGHRGACGYAPENTIESIRTAAELGAKWVELDVKLTKDQIPVIFHDDTLERTTNGSGNMADISYEDLRQLETGSWYADSFTGINVPTLEEVCEVLIEMDLGLNLEIKPCPGREIETAEVALDHLSRIWDDHDKLLISSFSHVSLEASMEVANDWKRGLLLHGESPDEWPQNWKELCDYLDCVTVHLNHEMATREIVEEISDYDKPVLIYTVNDPQLARVLQSWGVDSMFTDIPDVIEENLLTVH